MNDLPFVTDDDQRELASIARLGGALYRDRLFERARLIDAGYPTSSLADIDRWVAADAAAIVAGHQYVLWLEPGGPRWCAFERPEPRLTVSRAEAMLDWPIYRAGVLAPIRAILWPPEDPDRQWSPDTLDELAEVVIR